MDFCKNIFMVLLFGVTFALSEAAENAIKSLKYEDLLSFSKHSLPQARPFLIYFFQPDCPSCLRQKKDLACLPKNIQIVTMGVFGSKRELAAEARKHNLDGLLLYGGKAAENSFKIKQTPTLIFYSQTGHERKRVNSWLPCSSLKTLKLD